MWRSDCFKGTASAPDAAGALPAPSRASRPPGATLQGAAQHMSPFETLMPSLIASRDSAFGSGQIYGVCMAGSQSQLQVFILVTPRKQMQLAVWLNHVRDAQRSIDAILHSLNVCLSKTGTTKSGVACCLFAWRRTEGRQRPAQVRLLADPAVHRAAVHGRPGLQRGMEVGVAPVAVVRQRVLDVHAPRVLRDLQQAARVLFEVVLGWCPRLCREGCT